MKLKQVRFAGLSIQQKFYALISGVAVVFVGIIAYSYLSISPLKSDWDTYQSQVAKRQTLLSHIKDEFGFGGAVHNFKDYILRGTQEYEDNAKKNITAIREMTAEYRELPDVTEEELYALDNIDSVVLQYPDEDQEIIDLVDIPVIF